MSKYIIPLEVKSCSGSQEFLVVADSVEEAVKKFEKGDHEFFSEEVNVENLEDVDPSSVYLYEEGSDPKEETLEEQIQTLTTKLNEQIIDANDQRQNFVMAEAENRSLKKQMGKQREYLGYCGQWFKENPPITGARLRGSSGFDFLKPMAKLLEKIEQNPIPKGHPTDHRPPVMPPSGISEVFILNNKDPKKIWDSLRVYYTGLTLTIEKTPETPLNIEGLVKHLKHYGSMINKAEGHT